MKLSFMQLQTLRRLSSFGARAFVSEIFPTVDEKANHTKAASQNPSVTINALRSRGLLEITKLETGEEMLEVTQAGREALSS